MSAYKKHTLFLVIAAMMALFQPSKIHAEDTPLPPGNEKQLKALQGNLLQQEKQKEHIQREMAAAEKDLESTKDKLVGVAASIQTSEKELNELDKERSALGKRQDEIHARLAKDRLSISRLVLALERLRRVPPEAMIIKPGAPYEAAQSALIMKDIIPALHARAETLRLNLEELETIQADLKTKNEKAVKAAEDLRKEQSKLSGLLDERKNLYAGLKIDLEEQQEKIASISARARNVQDLVQKLDEERTRRQNAVPTAPQQAKSGVARNYIPLAGSNKRLPIAGVIRVGYQEADAFGAASEGLTIEGRDSALVVAPMNGEVRFAGPFKNYGNMIILEHAGGYHSLIAGLEKIDTVVGQSVSTGEPLGTLKKSEGQDPPALYYELRLKGKPVNPAQMFSELG